MGKRDLVEVGRGEKHFSRHSFRKRALYSFLLIFSVLFFGTLAFHFIEHYTYVDSFYFVSMLATAQGPANTPATSVGKILASAIAFISVGAGIVALGYLFGPFLSRVIDDEKRNFDREEQVVSKKIRKYEKEI